MKILLIGFTKLAYMPYMNFYLEHLSQTKNEIHLLYWNRDGKPDIGIDYNVILHEFFRLQKDEVAKWKKINSFLKYRKTVGKLLKQINFDFVIVMHTIPGVLIYDILRKYFKGQYILDYRDITFEKIGIYRKIIYGLVNDSRVTFVSSDAFRKYIPNIDKIYTTHNILLDSLSHRKVRSSGSREHNPLRIRYWGFIRHEAINKIIIERLANDNRFELHYHGRKQETAANLQQYCVKQNITNVFFHGEYSPAERYTFAAKTELIHNIFENNAMKEAIANKYYDGVVFRIPQLCNRGSFMGDRISANGIGLACDPLKDAFADDVWHYYHSIIWNEFNQNCDRECKLILSQYNEAESVLDQIIDTVTFAFNGIIIANSHK